MPHVARDGACMLFPSNGQSGNLGDYDLCLSIRQPDGSWGEPCIYRRP